METLRSWGSQHSRSACGRAEPRTRSWASYLAGPTPSTVVERAFSYGSGDGPPRRRRTGTNATIGITIHWRSGVNPVARGGIVGIEGA